MEEKVTTEEKTIAKLIQSLKISFGIAKQK